MRNTTKEQLRNNQRIIRVEMVVGEVGEESREREKGTGDGGGVSERMSGGEESGEGHCYNIG